MTTTSDLLRLDEPWCTCLVRIIADHAVDIVEPCWAHAPIGPAGFHVGERRDYAPGSPLDGAVTRAAKGAAR